VCGQVVANLAGLVVEAIADAFPGEVADDLRRSFDEDTLDRRSVVQVSADEGELSPKVGDAPWVAARANHRSRVNSSGEKSSGDVGAEESARSGEEDFHGRLARARLE
jgi:hypothetical protein